MATIKQIDGQTIHQIQSGQVIVDLCSVVKELVENSIDAGATSIDARFRNQGLDLIEVQDNGSGISPANYSALALKHHTSKLSSYSDISSLQTFGFRGEALASLCALSTLSVTTCQAADVPRGSKLAFEPSGRLSGSSVVAAQKGTTVSVEKLFHNLPVRRRELERNIKREWHKVIALLNQYACIQTGLKFTVSQQPTKGKRVLLFSTKGNPTTRENIINIFGAKTLTVLVPLDLCLKLQPTTVPRGSQVNSTNSQLARDVRVVGHVSRPTNGDGRQTPDRQMFFVNGRPCGLPQFAKAFNEVYKSYNSAQNPFILADIQLDTHMYDVNVSPDKRSILLHDQNDLLETLRSSLTDLFDSQDHTVPTSQLLKSRQSLDQAKTSQESAPNRLPKALSPAAESESLTDSESESETGEERSISFSAPRGRARIIPTARSLSRDTGGQNLISRWVERNTGSRLDEKPDSQFSASRSPGSQDGRVAVTAQPEGGNADSTTSSDIEDDGKLRPVQDFNKRLKESSTNALSAVVRATRSHSQPSEDEEPPIPTLQPTWTSSPGRGGRATRTRAHPINETTPQENATIIIGDHDDASVRNHDRKSSLEAKTTSNSAMHSTGLSTEEPQPSFGSRLTQLFMAQKNTSKADETGSSQGDNDDSDTSSQSPDVHGNGQGETTLADTRKTLEEDRASSSLFVSEESPARDESVANEDASLEESDLAPVDEHAQEQTTANSRSQTPRSGSRKKEATWQTVHHLRADEDLVRSRMQNWMRCIPGSRSTLPSNTVVADLGAADAEEKLSLIISKGDFSRMRIAGQFNLGFIIAIRPAASMLEEGADSSLADDDELFIIDQHATDEKYNFEKLQDTTVLQSQRLVNPKRLELTALEEEIVLQNIPAIEANGFKVDVDTSGDEPVGSRCQILALPLSRETTFTLSDFEELVSLLSDESAESKHIPRPSRVRKMFAMRACRSSIMIGRPLTQSQMETLVRHMGELDKPWNCPHGRPTMRHLCKLQPWDQMGWKRDRRSSPSRIAWGSYARR